eukprot:tig00000865_g5077.t1
MQPTGAVKVVQHVKVAQELYKPFRETNIAERDRHIATEPTYTTLKHDRIHWLRDGAGRSLGKAERFREARPLPATDAFYDIDTGPKRGVSRSVGANTDLDPWAGPSCRSAGAEGRARAAPEDEVSGDSATGFRSEAPRQYEKRDDHPWVGPGSYDPKPVERPPLEQLPTPAFRSGSSRLTKLPRMHGPTYSSVDADRRHWVRRGFSQQEWNANGRSFGKDMRFGGSPGGSGNSVGPGAYQLTTQWPDPKKQRQKPKRYM